MKIKLSKSQWQQIGKTAGWMKQAEESGDSVCKSCGEKFPTEECIDKAGIMKGCPKCGSKYVRKL